MKVFMKKVAESVDSGLSQEERNLLSVAYKNVIGSRRAAWRILSSLENKEDAKTEKYKELVIDYRKKVEKELNDICNEILELLDNFLIPNSEEDDEATVFFHKM